MGTINDALDYLADIVTDGIYQEEHYTSKSASANSRTTVQTFTIPAGRWLIISHMDLSSNAGGTMNHILNNRVVRSTGANGGGSVNFRIVNSENAYTVTAEGQAAAATTIRNTINCIRLGDYIAE